MLYRLVYTSTSRITALKLSNQLQNIRDASERRNCHLEITGVLIACKGKFTQVLEGSLASVTSLFALICNDPRHEDVTVLNWQRIEVRQFDEWDMLDAMDQIIAFPTRPSFRIDIINSIISTINVRPTSAVAAIIDISREAVMLKRSPSPSTPVNRPHDAGSLVSYAGSFVEG